MKEDELTKLLARGMAASACPVIITDRQGLIVYVNPMFTAKTGYRLEELRGQTPRVLQSPQTPLLLHEDLWNIITAGRPWYGELCNRRKNGEEFWEAIAINGIKDDQGVITHFVGVWQDITQRKKDDDKSEEEKVLLQKQSRTDDLTGLYNRRHIFVELEREFERALRYKRPLSGMMVDIDDFKKINDHYGHLMGDRIVRTFAKILEDSVRTIDILGRYGGDEFLLILPETPLDEARYVAERIRKNVNSYRENVTGEFASLTVSIGLVEFDEACRKDKSLFIEKIDNVLLKAKRAGKNQVVIG